MRTLRGAFLKLRQVVLGGRWGISLWLASQALLDACVVRMSICKQISRSLSSAFEPMGFCIYPRLPEKEPCPVGARTFLH